MTALQQTEIEELIMEVLIARWRLGENIWPFNDTKPILQALMTLEGKGWLGYKNGVVQHTLNAWPTVDGIVQFTGTEYFEPVRRQTLQEAKAEVWDECAREANEYVRLDDGIEESELIGANPYRETP